MKLTHFFTTAIAALVLAVPASAEDETPLDKEMEKISKSIKLVNRNLSDASKKDENVAKVTEAISACEAASKLEPRMTKDVPAAEKEKFLSDYKAAITEMGKQLGELKAAIEAGNADEAAKVIEKLNAGKKEGHKKFKKDE